MTPPSTMLERWKALAEVENKRARETWGRNGGCYRRPETFEDPEITAARQRRDARIAAWHAEGMSVKDICKRIGLVETSVTRILRLRRLQARDKSLRDDRKAVQDQE